MQVIGFNLTKISGEKQPSMKSNDRISTNIEFKNIEKESVTILKDSDAVKVSFGFSIIYTKDEKSKEEEAKILFEGYTVLTTSKDELKEVLKSWKKKEVPLNIRLPLFNLIMQKCSLKALQLEEDLTLPAHIALPRLAPEQPSKDK